MKITKITAEWENGEKFSIEKNEVDTFFNSGTEATKMYLLLAFAKSLAGGFNWIREW